MSLGGTDLNLMVALRALLEEGNVTKAGAKIGKSQPTMSTALARLRRHYQDELLVRVGRDYELTPFAKALVPSVQQTMQCVELALDTGQRFDPATSRHAFRIDATDYAITVLAEPLLRRVAAVAPRHPAGLRRDPRRHARVRARAAQLRRADRAARLRLPRLAGAAVPRPVRLRGRPANPRLRDGRLTLEDLSALPHAVRDCGRTHVTPGRPGHGRAVRPAAGPGDDRGLPAAAVPRRGDGPGRGRPGAAGAARGGVARADGGRAAVRPGGADRDALVAPRPRVDARARLAAPDR